MVKLFGPNLFVCYNWLELIRGVDISLLNAIAFDPYAHGYYTIGKRVGNAFSDGLKLKI